MRWSRVTPGLLVLYSLAIAAHAQGKKYAVLVGISQYRDARGLEWVQHADDDAEAFAAHLKSERGGKVDEIEILTNGKATRTNILDTIRRVLTVKAGPNDTVYLFLSARGLATAESDEGFIEAYESAGEKNQSSAVRVSELRTYLNNSNANQIFLFADVDREPAASRIENRINSSWPTSAVSTSRWKAFLEASRRENPK